MSGLAYVEDDDKLLESTKIRLGALAKIGLLYYKDQVDVGHWIIKYMTGLCWGYPHLSQHMNEFLFEGLAYATLRERFHVNDTENDFLEKCVSGTTDQIMIALASCKISNQELFRGFLTLGSRDPIASMLIAHLMLFCKLRVNFSERIKAVQIIETIKEVNDVVYEIIIDEMKLQLASPVC